VNNVHDTPELYRVDQREPRSWSALRLVGVQSNRSAIGSRVVLSAGGVTQVSEVRGGGSYYSQNDLRLHFGLGSAKTIDRVEVRWPNGNVEVWTGVEPNRIVTLTEGTGRPLPAKTGTP
jgi:enediyne biosynthesis protein E4